MLHRLIGFYDKTIGVKKASAHCDIPCKIYDPCVAQIAALSVIRFMDIIAELAKKDSLALADHAQLSRLLAEKETHAEKVKHEIRVIWGDYIKQPQYNKDFFIQHQPQMTEEWNHYWNFFLKIR